MTYFRQLFDTASSTYTYLLAERETNTAVLIDPVRGHDGLYLQLLADEHLSLRYLLETHVHADHITGASALREATGAKTAVSKFCGAACADIQLQGDEELSFGNERIRVIATPGHTPGSVSYLWRDRVFTGDALLIGGCGRTDFQGGDAGKLYDSITQKLWLLPDETLVYPAHDYNHRHVSSVVQERETNPRLLGKSREEFIDLMNGLDLPRPRLIDQAVPANRHCGNEVPHAA
ncbi:MAG: MBL fold metallo-hydrolase [Burkholderiales bacterium]